MDPEGVITLLQSIKSFRVNDELPFNTVDYIIIDEAIEFLAAQQGAHWTAYAIIGLAVFVLGAVVGFWLAGI